MRGSKISTANGKAMTTWPMATLIRPRPIGTGPRWNRISSATPSTTVGTTSGTSMSAEMNALPRTWRRARGYEAISAISVAMAAEPSATRIEAHSALRMSSEWKAKP